MVLDKSGSMQSVVKETISGLNEQLQSMVKAEKDYTEQEQRVCLVTFSSCVEITEFWNKKVADVPELTDKNYSPDGMTALFDAIGMSIKKLKEEIKDELASRTANVILTIFTDGQENASNTYDGIEIKKLIEEIKETGQWTVAFIGCGENVFDVAKSIGISAGNTMSYMTGAVGTKNAFATMSSARYTRAAQYSSNLASGKNTEDINNEVDFFAKDLDIGTDSDIIDKK